jgi:organic hydroperoxide reductase OsmC/OhrA
MNLSEEERTFSVNLKRIENYAFEVDFGLDGVQGLIVDEPEPLGAGQGPNASRMLAAAVGECLSASLLFCLAKARAEVRGMKTSVEGKLVRNDRGRWRVAELSVELTPDVPAEDAAQLSRCIDLFEDFCTVGKSVEQGIPLRIRVNRPSS